MRTWEWTGEDLGRVAQRLLRRRSEDGGWERGLELELEVKLELELGAECFVVSAPGRACRRVG